MATRIVDRLRDHLQVHHLWHIRDEILPRSRGAHFHPQLVLPRSIAVDTAVVRVAVVDGLEAFGRESHPAQDAGSSPAVDSEQDHEA